MFNYKLILSRPAAFRRSSRGIVSKLARDFVGAAGGGVVEAFLRHFVEACGILSKVARDVVEARAVFN